MQNGLRRWRRKKIIYRRKSVAGVRNQQTSFTDSSVANGNTFYEPWSAHCLELLFYSIRWTKLTHEISPWNLRSTTPEETKTENLSAFPVQFAISGRTQRIKTLRMVKEETLNENWKCERWEVWMNDESKREQGRERKREQVEEMWWPEIYAIEAFTKGTISSINFPYSFAFFFLFFL